MMKKRWIMIAVLALITVCCACGFAGCGAEKPQPTQAEPLKELPPPEITGGARGELGIDRNVNEETIDEYLNRPDAVYRDMRMLEDPGNYEAIGGDRYLSGYVEGFEVVPLPLILPVSGLPGEVGNTYTGTTLFHEENGRYVANYEESLETVEQLFPRDKVIFLMCGGGGYAGMTKHFLVSMGWDESRIYNVGGYWYYHGAHNVQVKHEENGAVTYDFDSVPYHSIDFSKMTKSGEYQDPIIPVTEVKLSTAKLELPEDSSFRLDVIVLPNEASCLDVQWTSSDESVAYVNGEGMVKALGEGEAVITATSLDGTRSASCAVTVQAREDGETIVLDDLAEDAEVFAANNLGKLYREFTDTVEGPDGMPKEEYMDPDGTVSDLWIAEYEKNLQQMEEAQQVRSEIFSRLIAEKKTFIVLIRRKTCEQSEYPVIDGAVDILQRNGVTYFEMGDMASDGDNTLGASEVGREIRELGGAVAIVKNGELYAGIDASVEVIHDEAELLAWFRQYLDLQ